eukprot:m.187487 g.187487  ORF g.187487 m.187487 type:complete len:123 (+) comp53577_c2_seq1:348-716(+)
MEKLAQHSFSCIFTLKRRRYWPIGIPGDLILDATKQLDLGQSVFWNTKATSPTQFFVGGLMDMDPCLLVRNAFFMGVSPNSSPVECHVRDGYSKRTVQLTRPEVLMSSTHFGTASMTPIICA